MKPPLSRRRFLRIAAAACAFPAIGQADTRSEVRWRGRALGAAASVQIVGMPDDGAANIFREIEGELERLESIFSLYRTDSVISRLNADGSVSTPPPDLLAVLSLSGQLHRATAGAFDPTVQPLYAMNARAVKGGTDIHRKDMREALSRVGWDAVTFDETQVRLRRDGAAVTLNGIAQGYITDRIADLLRRRGLQHVLIDIGEVAALGNRADELPWRIGIAHPDGTILRRLTLTDRALATSAPMGTALDPAGRIGHIFDPANGETADGLSVVSVSAPSAAVADGLSTALCVAAIEGHHDIVARFPGARVETAI